jgi:alkylation response protein AidB-like acyl-CoA dehydrogenase
MRPETAKQHALAEDVAKFLSSEPEQPPFESLDARVAYLRAYQARLHRVGLSVPAWPPEYGGRGLGHRDAAVVAGALGAGGAPELINFVGTDVLGPALFRYGRTDDLLRWMPPMAAADEIWCQLFSEPEAGSDLASLRTRAEQRADGNWVINGQKVWSTWAQYATWGFLLARTGPADSRHRGISAFVLQMDRPGLEIRPLRTMTGSAEFAEVFFEDVELEPATLVGEVDGGWAIAQVILAAERGPYAVRRAAVIGAALARSLAIARTRSLTPSLRELTMRAWTDFRILEFRISQLVGELAAGAEIGRRAAVTKELMTRAERSTFELGFAIDPSLALAVTTHAGELAVEDYLYSRAASIYGGSTQIQHNIIGEAMLGLPREPAPHLSPSKTLCI